MELNKFHKVKIKDICTWERSKKEKVYPAESWCVQVSATKGQMIYLDEASKVDSKYCVFTLTTENYIPEYVYIMFKNNLQRFLNKVQTGLNIVPEVFEEYEIELHDDISTQDSICKTMRYLDERIEQEERIIAKCKELKRYHSGKMFF